MAFYLLLFCILCGVGTDSYDVYTDGIIPTKGKPAVQSGTYLDHNASLALDGDPATFSATCSRCNNTHTGDNRLEWWQVDLEDNYIITSVSISNPTYSQYFMSKRFYMSSTAIVTTWNNSINSDERGHVCEKDETAPAGLTDDTHIRCVIPIPGRYVTISRTGTFWPRASYLSFGEVKFFGYLYRRVYDNETVVSLDKPTTQSGTYQAHVSSYAVDGHPATCSISVACTTCDRSNTGVTSFAWWQVDLGSNYIVTSVAITSSLHENNSKYLQHFIIWISTDNGTDLTSSEGQVCYNYNNGSILPRGEETTLNCTEPVTGRYVTIKRNGGCFRPDALTLCEVKVFGYLYTNATIHRHPPTTKGPLSGGVKGALSSDVLDDLSTVKLLGSLLGFSFIVIGILVIASGLKIRQLNQRIKELSDSNNDDYPIVLSDELDKGAPSNEY